MGYIEIPDVTLQMIIEAGFIAPNTIVYNTVNENIVGKLNEDGSITLNVEGKIQTYPFPSGAARAVVHLSVNGWIFWKVKDNGIFNDLKFYKLKYIEATSSDK